MHTRSVSTLALLALFLANAHAADPKDNPIATFYSGPEGYPAWTDSIQWSRVINMQTYKKGKTEYEKFLKARDELSEGGGVLYYPAGNYDFTNMPPGVALTLVPGIVIRGEAPKGHPVASDGKLELATKFLFPFRERGGGKTPRDWNFISLQPDGKRNIKTRDRLGIVWVHLVGATIALGPQMDWGATWGSAQSLLSDQIKGGWAKRDPSGTHPIDALAGGGKRYQGAGNGRIVFGCVLEDAAVLDDYSDPGYGSDGFRTSPQLARIIAYGSNVLVANNLLPRSRKNFRYRQKTTAPGKGSMVMFDYGKTCGIDINKELLSFAGANGTCPGYYEEGIVVRDNYVFNHGHTGFNISGNWVSITGNHNDRAVLRQGDDIYGIGGGWISAFDGYEAAGPNSDNRSRAFDLAGRNLWIDNNRFNNTGSLPGNDGEGIIGRLTTGTPLFSWAITHNTHGRGAGSASGIGALDNDCHGLLVAWNTTSGWVGCLIKNDGKLSDCAFVGNKAERVVPDEKTIAKLNLRKPLLAAAPGKASAPTKIDTEVYKDHAVKITWAGGSEGAIGFRVDRRIGEGKWQPIAYRPPHSRDDPDNLPEWIDFTAPPGKELCYRVVAIDADDTDVGASMPTAAVSLTAR
jgi:hypothetical protein